MTASFTGPRAVYPDPEVIEELLPEIQALLEGLPHSSPDALYALARLTSSTDDLTQNLNNVSDSLQLSRQPQNQASRTLRAVKDLLAEWKKHAEQSEQAVLYLDKGDWDRRLREREAKRACSDVIDGFEEMCGMWRKRLCGGLSA